MATPNKKPSRKRSFQRDKRLGGLRSARTWKFEQLESRAMLSATMGPMVYGPDMQAFAMRDDGMPHFAEAGMFAPPIPNTHAEATPDWNGWMNGPMTGGWRGHRTMPDGFDQGPDPWDNHSTVPAHSAFTNPNPQPELNPNNEVGYLFTDTYFGPGFVLTVETVKFVSPPAGPPPNGGPPPWEASATNKPSPPLYDSKPFGGNDTSSPGKGLSGTTSQNSGTSSQYILTNTSPVSTQSAFHEGGLSSLTSNSALDAALNAYTSQLLLVSGNANSLSSASAHGDPPTSTSDTNDFMLLSDLSTPSNRLYDVDVVARERAALEEVLRGMQVVDSLPIETTDSTVTNDGSLSEEQNAQAADLAFATAFGVTDIDGGMVLLRTSGDANENQINLATVAESHPDMFNPHVGVEATVGFYQAVDRGIEELSATSSPASTTPAELPAKTAKPDNRLSTGRETTSRKTGLLVTASALAGALLLCSTHKRREDEQNSNSPSGDNLAL